MARPKKKEEDKRIRIDITITKDEAAKLEEISRITGLKKSVIISKMIEQTQLEGALEYARLQKMVAANVWGAKHFVPKIDTEQNEMAIIRSCDEEEENEDCEDNQETQPLTPEEIARAMEIARERWGLNQ